MKKAGTRPAFLLPFCDLFHETGDLEGLVRAVLLHGLEALRRDDDRDLLAELLDEEGLFLKKNLAAALTGRIELGSSNTV